MNDDLPLPVCNGNQEYDERLHRRGALFDSYEGPILFHVFCRVSHE